MLRLATGLFLLLVVMLGAVWSTSRAPLAEAAAVKSLAGCNDATLGPIDDSGSQEALLPFDLNFFGTTYTSVHVNNNGNVTFGNSLTAYTPFPLLDTSTVIIAPFFADVDTRGSGSGTTKYGTTTFGGRTAFCVNWLNVGYYSAATDKLNSFQLLLVDRSDTGDGDFDMIFNYDQIQWEAGSASGGTNGLGGNSARVGYSNGSDASFELPGSAVNGAFLDSAATALRSGSRSSATAGRYIFSVRNGQAPVGGTITGTVFGDPDGSAGAAGQSILPNSIVQACSPIEPPIPCEVTSTNSSGDYQFTGLLTGRNWFVTAFPPSGFENLGPRRIGALFLSDAGIESTAGTPGKLHGQNITLIPPRPIPPDVTIHSPYRAQNGTTVAVSSLTSTFFERTGACPGGSGMWKIEMNGQTIQSGMMTETSSGTYEGKILPLPGVHGLAVMTITIDCPGGPDEVDVFDIYKDPSGNVYDQDSGLPVEGATVTLMRADTGAGPFEVVPDGSEIMSPSNRTNPDLTDAEGFFRWDVIAGFYKLRIEKDGCTDPANASLDFIESTIYEVPPPVDGLEFFLDCGGAPGPTNTPVGPTNTPTNTPSGPTNTPTNTPVGPTNTPVQPTATPTSPPSQGEPGDATCNGEVNAIDAALVLQHTAGLVAVVPCPDLADVNEDGMINSIDSAIILQYTAGLINSLPV